MIFKVQTVVLFQFCSELCSSTKLKSFLKMTLEIYLDLFSQPCRSVYIFAKKNNIQFDHKKISLFDGMFSAKPREVCLIAVCLNFGEELNFRGRACRLYVGTAVLEFMIIAIRSRFLSCFYCVWERRGLTSASNSLLIKCA